MLMCVHGLKHTPATEDTLGSEVLSHHRGCVHTVCVLVCVCIPVGVMSVCVGVIPGAQGHWVCEVLSGLSTYIPHTYTQTYVFITLPGCRLLAVGCLEPQLLALPPAALCCLVPPPLSITSGVPVWTSLPAAGIIRSGLSSPGSPAPLGSFD